MIIKSYNITCGEKLFVMFGFIIVPLLDIAEIFFRKGGILILYPGVRIQKIIPAMLMGNTVILKPSQHTPLSSYFLADAFEQAGFPKGVFNLVTGRGGEVGDALSSHPLVSMISFTGSTSGGVTVGKRAANRTSMPVT